MSAKPAARIVSLKSLNTLLQFPQVSKTVRKRYNIKGESSKASPKMLYFFGTETMSDRDATIDWGPSMPPSYFEDWWILPLIRHPICIYRIVMSQIQSSTHLLAVADRYHKSVDVYYAWNTLCDSWVSSKHRVSNPVVPKLDVFQRWLCSWSTVLGVWAEEWMA